MNVKVQNQPLEHKRTADGLCGPKLEMFRGQVQRGNDEKITTASIMQFVNIWLWKNFMRGKTKLRPCQFYMLYPGTCANNSFLWKEDKSLFTLFPPNCSDVFFASNFRCCICTEICRPSVQPSQQLPSSWLALLQLHAEKEKSDE